MTCRPRADPLGNAACHHFALRVAKRRRTSTARHAATSSPLGPGLGSNVALDFLSEQAALELSASR